MWSGLFPVLPFVLFEAIGGFFKTLEAVSKYMVAFFIIQLLGFFMKTIEIQLLGYPHSKNPPQKAAVSHGFRGWGEIPRRGHWAHHASGVQRRVTQKSRDLSIKDGDFTKKQWEYHGILVGYIYIYMMIDLKVLVTSFNCEDRSCYAGNPSRKFFFLRVRKRKLSIRESFAKVGYCESLSLYTLQLVKGYHLLPTGCPAGEWYHIFTFPSFRRSGFATVKCHGPEAHDCTCRRYCLTLLSEVSRNKLQMQQPSFRKWGSARAKHQGPWCLLFLWCTPCWWLGSADRGIFAKVPRRSGRKSKRILKGVAR